MTKTAIILRGLPGSGKSTVAALFKKNDAVTISMDNFWLEQGCRFDSTRLQEAIRWTRRQLDVSIERGCQFIVVDNTHTRSFEMEYYVKKLQADDYQVHVLHVEADLASCAMRQTHGVAEDKLLAMRDRWEPLAPKDPEARLRHIEEAMLALAGRSKS